jgi:Family of unknown function (DUF5357)
MDAAKFWSLVLDSLKKYLKPPKLASWQSLILASIGFAIASFFVAVQFPLIILACILLIGGVAWYTTKEPMTIQGISLGSWLTGGLICLFLFGIWGNPALWPIGLVAWPLVSAILAAIPEFWTEGLKLKTPAPGVRQGLLILLLVHVVLSCWLFFIFVLQGWLQQYPSLVADDYSRSAFVNKIDFGSNPAPRGSRILNGVEERLRTEIDGKIWPNVERWLLNANERIDKISQDTINNLGRVEEDALWNIQSDVSSRDSGYNLQLVGNWNGPGSRLKGYHVSKSCQITLSRSRGRAARSPVSLSNLQCTPVTAPQPGAIDIENSENTNNPPKT